MLHNPLLHWKAVSIKPKLASDFRLPISKIKMAGSAAFCHVNIGKFILLPLGSMTCNSSCYSITPRAFPALSDTEKEIRNANNDDVKQSLIGQGVVETSKWKSAAG
jgi:hypothetical protein